MALALNLYDIFRKKQMSGQNAIDLNVLAVYMQIVTVTHTPNQNTHDFEDDITNEVVGDNYTAGGNILANPVIALDGSGNASIDFDDPADWLQHATGFTDGRRHIFYVKRGGASSADELIGYSDAAAGDFGNVVADYSVQLAAVGLYTSAR